MYTTYGMACPVCVWMVDNRPTTEHVEWEYLAHVRAQHPENVERRHAEAARRLLEPHGLGDYRVRHQRLRRHAWSSSIP